MIRLVLSRTRKMLGKDIEPQLISARVPRVFWANTLMMLPMLKGQLSERIRSIAYLRAAARIGCPF
jgi:hypothetical protein